MPKKVYYNPAERIYEAGGSKITAEEAVSLKGDKPKLAKRTVSRRRKKPLSRAIFRKLREVWHGPKTYLRETPAERKKRVALERR